MAASEHKKAYDAKWQRDNRDKCREYSRRYTAIGHVGESVAVLRGIIAYLVLHGAADA